MRYRKTPLEKELAAMRAEGRAKEATDLIGALLRETMSTRGFQLVTVTLRELEGAVLTQLRVVADASQALRLTGQLHAIENIRRSLRALLPDQEQARVDWFDDEDAGPLINTGESGE